MSHLQPSPRSNSGRNLSPTPIGRRTPSPSRTRRSVGDTSIPLLEKEVNTSNPPLAGPETDTESDERDTVNKSYPGVDDGFFSKPTEVPNPDVETIPISPQPQVPLSPKVPEAVPDGRFPQPPRSHPGNGNGRYPDNNFPYAPGFGPDVYNVPDYAASEFNPLGESIPDINYYQQKKTLAQGMMDLALFSANANQLRYVLESYERHPYYYPSVVFISISLIIQVAVGIGLIWNSRYNVKDQKEICIANKISNMTIIGIFIVTVVNVFISAFGVANAAPTVVVQPTDAG